ncbi:MAG: phospho-N-acetylmuramoyl-pentapeptide-transferase [Candidatus Delongbacteria bacterium]|nr:phospho-N-acetylmuramoyl-pentapeptide-transferase [Candidatus Delongbacteria bacterium]
MLYLLGNYLMSLSEQLSFLRLVNYLTFRASMTAFTAFVLTIWLGHRLIIYMYRRQWRDVAHDLGVMSVHDKRGTPTMGGLILLIAIVFSLLLWGRLESPFLWLSLAALLWFGLIGLIDDLLKIKHGSGKYGLSPGAKLLMQALFGAGLAFYLLYSGWSPLPEQLRSELFLPFMKHAVADLHGWYALFIIFVIVAISNSVNFADGMDGLAIVPVSTAYLVYAVFAYVVGNVVYSTYLNFDYIPGAGEIVVITTAVIGAGMGFLWYNAYPAQVFMGDVGSQALGGMLATIVILLKQEFLFLIAGGIFVVEGASVFIQQKIGFKMGRRFFFRAPIHHTFEYRGVSETKVTVRFWIVSFLLAFVSLVFLKVR